MLLFILVKGCIYASEGEWSYYQPPMHFIVARLVKISLEGNSDQMCWEHKYTHALNSVPPPPPPLFLLFSWLIRHVRIKCTHIQKMYNVPVCFNSFITTFF